MPQIHLLDQETINQIAAGEVVERPMAVVKELVENAIDAGANAITVEIRDGGKALIRITDNGCGIASEEIPLAFLPHTTSKIQDATDLLAVSSLGFRGEALASIAAVSQLEMVTKTRDALMGIRYVIEGGAEKTNESVGCPEGTTFIVRNLFYNTPARLKFLKTSPTEAGYINTALERLALSHPEIAFRFINQNQPKLTTAGNGNLKDVIYHIYGKEVAANLLEIHTKEVFAQVDGFLGKPILSRGNRSYMNYFINGRYIRSTVIHRAIEEAYSQYTMQHRYPFTVLHLTIDPQYIDVNVHPQKMEIRFTREQEIFQSIYHAVAEGLKQKEFIPEIRLQREPQIGRKKDRGNEPFEIKRRAERKEAGNTKPLPQTQQDRTGQEDPTGSVQNTSQTGNVKPPQEEIHSGKDIPQREKVQFGRREQSQGTGRSEMINQPQKAAPLKETRQIPDVPQDREMGQPQETGIFHKAEQAGLPLQETEAESRQRQQVAEPVPVYGKQQSLFGDGILSDQAVNEIRMVGQIFSTYWIMEYEDSMYLVDQHAAHEKVLYERFMKQIRGHQPMIQMTQPPIVLTLSMAEQQILEEQEELFTALGFQIESFGGREYAVTGVPAHLPTVNTVDMLTDALDMLAGHHGGTTPELLLERVASMSCKAAVKGNHRLDVRQAEELIREMMTLENPYHCPHGRPTMIRMSKRELEKKFKRIL